jgi:hypothetical protein
MKKLLIIIIAIAAFIPYACKKEGGSSGQPVVTGVRSIDTTERDSLFTQAVPGTLIVIEGNNFGGLQAVYFNDTSAYFNPSYATSTNIIITIPSTAQTSATNPDVKNIIRIVTDHGETSYSFSLYLPPPTISSISFDNSGTIVYINGNNFEGIQKITFPVSGDDTALSYEVNKTYTQITAEIPHATAFTDSLRVYCTFGYAAYAYPPPMTITSISNENGIAGTTITLTGTNFVGISKVIFPGGLEGTNLVTNSVSQVSVTVPEGITTPDSLRMQGALGTATAPQLFDTYITHPSPGYLSTFDVQYAGDNTGFVGWTGGYESAPAPDYPNATGSVAFFQQASAMKGNTNPGSQGNAGFIQLNDVPWVSNTSESINNYSLKFEVYVAKPWKAGEIWVMMGDWYGWSNNYLARYAPWATDPDGNFQPAGWVTATIPLTDFISFSGNAWDKTSFPTGGSPASKFSDYPSTALCFAIVNDQPSPDIPSNTLNIAIDNVRIVKVK